MHVASEQAMIIFEIAIAYLNLKHNGEQSCSVTKQFSHTGGLQTKAFKSTTSNQRDVENYLQFLLQIWLIYYSNTIGIKVGVISHNFVILVTFK
jgi:hypothetical protein